MSDRTSVEKSTSDKRAAILEATLNLITERGFHNTPMSMVAKASGASTGIIYHYFTGKEELINELYREIKLEAIQVTLAGYSEELSFHKRFLKVWFNVVSYSLHNPKKGTFLEQFENSPYLKPSLQEDYSKKIAPLFSFFQQGVKEDIFKDLPLPVLLDLTFKPAISLAKQHIAGVIVLDDELMQAAANACWDAVKR